MELVVGPVLHRRSRLFSAFQFCCGGYLLGHASRSRISPRFELVSAGGYDPMITSMKPLSRFPFRSPSGFLFRLLLSKSYGRTQLMGPPLYQWYNLPPHLRHPQHHIVNP